MTEEKMEQTAETAVNEEAAAEKTKEKETAEAIAENAEPAEEAVDETIAFFLCEKNIVCCMTDIFYI